MPVLGTLRGVVRERERAGDWAFFWRAKRELWSCGEVRDFHVLRWGFGFRETGVVPHDGITLAHSDHRHGGEKPSHTVRLYRVCMLCVV